MEYTPDDYTFWGQVLPQVIWIFIIIVVFGLLVALGQRKEEKQQAKNKQIAEIEDRRTERVKRMEKRFRKQKLLKDAIKHQN